MTYLPKEAIIFAIAALAPLLAGCDDIAAKRAESERKTAMQAQQAAAEAARLEAEAAAQKDVAARLRDPESARFQNLRTSIVASREGSRIKGFCGEVNAKNLMGAYVGYRPFLYVLERTYSPTDKGRTWHAGNVYIAAPEACGFRQDIERLCGGGDGAILSEIDVDGATTNLGCPGMHDRPPDSLTSILR